MNLRQPYPQTSQYSRSPPSKYLPYPPIQSFNSPKTGCVMCDQAHGSYNTVYQGPTSFYRQSTTPKFPQKLKHSYVTSGHQAQQKKILIQPAPVPQPGPFQAQRRISYMPYMRKYYDYQEYIQYVPVERSEWNYQKVMKQIDFIPQQYYETKIEYYPKERIQNKIKYIPVEQQILYFPEDVVLQDKNKIYRQENIRQTGQIVNQQKVNYVDNSGVMVTKQTYTNVEQNYQFPSKGGVMIGGSMSNRFGPGSQLVSGNPNFSLNSQITEVTEQQHGSAYPSKREGEQPTYEPKPFRNSQQNHEQQEYNNNYKLNYVQYSNNQQNSGWQRAKRQSLINQIENEINDSSENSSRIGYKLQ